MQTSRRLSIDSPATYRLRIQGILDERWSDYIDGAMIREQSQPDEPPVTLITADFQDQAALSGALSLLYDLGLPLLSVECVGISPQETD